MTPPTTAQIEADAILETRPIAPGILNLSDEDWYALRDRIAAALAEETERCAKIAEAWQGAPRGLGFERDGIEAWAMAADQIAAKIREGR